MKEQSLVILAEGLAEDGTSVNQARELLKEGIRKNMSSQFLENIKRQTREELYDELTTDNEDVLNDLKDEIVVDKKLVLFEDLKDDIYEYLAEQN